MHNIIEIARYDIRHLFKNAIALIVLSGLVLIPSMYAWFNTQASWDPYGNTKAIHIAVANQDEGYKGDLMPVRINLGESVLNSLRENDHFTWEYVSASEAEDGVASGKYYASIVIPKSFSQDMLTFFSNDSTCASITYYSNEKVNAIAPKITEKGANAIQKQINEDFSATVETVVLSAATDVVGFFDSDQVQSYGWALVGRLGEVCDTTQQVIDTTDSFTQLIEGSANLLQSTSALGTSLHDVAGQADGVVGNVGQGMDNVASGFESASDMLGQALSQSSSAYDAVSESIDDVYAGAASSTSSAVASLNSIAAKVQSQIDSLRQIRDALAQILPDQSVLLSDLDAAIASCSNLHDAIISGASDLENAQGNAIAKHEQIVGIIRQAQDALTRVDTAFNTELKGQVDQLQASLEQAHAASANAVNELSGAMDGMQTLTSSLSGSLEEVQDAFGQARQTLSSMQQSIESVQKDLSHALEAGDLEHVRTIVKSDGNGLIGLLSSPVTLKTHGIYPVKNYGSVMVGYYSALSIWIGATILVAMLSIDPAQECLAKLGIVKNYEKYLGHYVMFFAIASCQGILIALGNIFFLRIQCLHPVEFIFACWLASVVFSAIVYTLTVSFGDIGKAIAVLLLVIQVAGSGGTFPIQMTPHFFQLLAPYLPFTPLMNALHACVGGIYGNEFWAAMLQLLSFLIPVLLLGLVLRKPVIRFNKYFTEKLEETKIM